MALLAYEEPENSPLFHYLTDEYRQSIADALNCAVLGMLRIWPKLGKESCEELLVLCVSEAV